jgi:ASPIC and UnbV
MVWRRVRTDGSHLSASDGRVRLGLGDSPTIVAVVVQWPDGQWERWLDVAADSSGDAAPWDRARDAGG